MLVEEYKNKNIVVYGAGSCFHWFYEIFYIKHNIIPKAVIDKRFAEIDSYEGFFASNNLKNLPFDKLNNITVLVAVGNKETYNEIKAEASKFGVAEICFLHEFYEINNPFDKNINEYSLLNDKDKSKINILRNKLSDELSQDIFDCVVRTHQTKKPEMIRASKPEEQYFPHELGEKLNYEYSIFCGADNHDLVKLTKNIGKKIKSLTIFEPDSYVFNELKTSANCFNNIAENFQIFQIAISSKDGINNFNSANSQINKRKHVTGYGSMLSVKGKEYVLAMMLDSIYVNSSVTFLGMDIEGEELEALKGAIQLLKRNTPDLAISLYHAPDHIWQVIELLVEKVPVYNKFYLRNYTGYMAETVLYAFSR